MKKFLTILLTFFVRILLGILPALQGTLAIYDLQKAITYIRIVGSAAGWQAVQYGLYALVYIAFMIWFTYDLGRDFHHAINWRVYRREQVADTIDSGTSDCETSDEAADTSSDIKSKGKRKKS